MKERGRDGALGQRWKDKQVPIDDTHLYYIGHAAIGVLEIASIEKVTLVDGDTSRPYLFAASSPEDISTFSSTLLDLKSSIASHRSSG